MNWFINEALPDFTEDDPIAWVTTAERFFQKQKIHSSDKMQWAFMRMSGIALLWFTDWCQENCDADWESFAIALIRRFGNGKSDGAVQEQIKEEDEMESIPHVLNEKKRSQVDLEEDGDRFDGKTRHSGVDLPGTSRRKDRLVFIEQPPPPPDMPPEPPDYRRSAMVIPRRASPLKPPFLDVSLCKDVLSTKLLPEKQKRTLSKPPDASFFTTVTTGSIVKSSCVSIAEQIIWNIMEIIGSHGLLVQYHVTTGKCYPFTDIPICDFLSSHHFAHMSPFQSDTSHNMCPTPSKPERGCLFPTIEIFVLPINSTIIPLQAKVTGSNTCSQIRVITQNTFSTILNCCCGVFGSSPDPCCGQVSQNIDLRGLILESRCSCGATLDPIYYTVAQPGLGRLVCKLKTYFINVGYGKKGARSYLKPYYGPKLMAEYLVQFSNKFLVACTMGQFAHIFYMTTISDAEFLILGLCEKAPVGSNCSTFDEYQKRDQVFWNEFVIHDADPLESQQVCVVGPIISQMGKSQMEVSCFIGTFTLWARIELLEIALQFNYCTSIQLKGCFWAHIRRAYKSTNSCFRYSQWYRVSSDGAIKENFQLELFHLVNMKVKFLCSLDFVIPWVTGEFYFPMKFIAYACYWSNFLIFNGLSYFAFDRGKRQFLGHVWQPRIQLDSILWTRLELSPTTRIHLVFHVSPLKKAIGNAAVHPDLHASLEVVEEAEWEPDVVLAHRVEDRHGESVPQVLIHWSHKPIDEATWEDKEFIAAQFPTFSLEDKADSHGAGNDRAQDKSKGKPVIWRVYEKRKKNK